MERKMEYNIIEKLISVIMVSMILMLVPIQTFAHTVNWQTSKIQYTSKENRYNKAIKDQAMKLQQFVRDNKYTYDWMYGGIEKNNETFAHPWFWNSGTTLKNAPKKYPDVYEKNYPYYARHMSCSDFVTEVLTEAHCFERTNIPTNWVDKSRYDDSYKTYTGTFNTIYNYKLYGLKLSPISFPTLNDNLQPGQILVDFDPYGQGVKQYHTAIVTNTTYIKNKLIAFTVAGSPESLEGYCTYYVVNGTFDYQNCGYTYQGITATNSKGTKYSLGKHYFTVWQVSSCSM